MINLVRVAHVSKLYTKTILASENISLHEHVLVSVSHTIYLHGICCQFLLTSYWIPHWLLFDVLYLFLFLYVHSYFCTGEVRIKVRSCEAYQQVVAYYVL